MKKMKSFRLFVPEPPSPPERVVTDFTAEEKAAFAETLKPVLQRYHKRASIAHSFLWGFIVCWCLGVFWAHHQSKSAYTALLYAGASCFLLAISFAPRLPTCPACKRRSTRPFGAFCPECGSRSLQPETALLCSQCRSCGCDLRRGKSRRYKVHYCTHCGLHLDDNGL